MKSKVIFWPRILSAVVIAIASLWLNSCDSDEADPCKVLNETSADFTMEEAFVFGSDGNTFLYACDTAIIRRVRFKAVDSLATSYEWKIGSGVYTTRSVTLDFFNTTETEIPITLIVNKEPNSKCFPQDNGMDTVSRALHFVEPLETLVSGIYEGANTDAPNDKYTIEVQVRTSTDPQFELELYVYESKINCWIRSVDPIIGFRGVATGDLWGGTEPCTNTMHLSHRIILDKDKKTVTIIRYFFINNLTQYVSNTFKGTRQ